jgi:hypothetical protein
MIEAAAVTFASFGAVSRGHALLTHPHPARRRRALMQREQAG